MDDSLQDDVWKDSFDKLLDHRPQLRELNILKKQVRVSFNIDSSVENSNPNLNVSECDVQNDNSKNGSQYLNINKKKLLTISTPSAKRMSMDLFRCAISPITGMKLDGIYKISNQGPNLIANDKPLQTRHVCFDVDLCSQDNTIEEQKSPQKFQRQSRSSVKLQPGKWRKSLKNWRRTNQIGGPGSLSPKQSLQGKKVTMDSIIIPQKLSIERKSVYINDTLEPSAKPNYEKEVLKYCGQRRARRFNVVYSTESMINTCKIGEGVYGEVFKYTPKMYPSTNIVLKVIPIEGDALVNGEVQKNYEQILPEIIISKELSNLREHESNSTFGFVDIKNVCLVKGKYPQHLKELWEKYDAEKESENEHPEMFTDCQLFIVLELNFAGKDMSEFKFVNAEQTYYALQQVVLTLAVGEEAFQFEHRDLHWGNMLVQETDTKEINYTLNGKLLSVPTKGVLITIIDYTLSRITVKECCHYNDLSTDEELFVATGDYQYDIYRMMRDELKNDWSIYVPKTNVMWISYVNSKLIDGVKYKSITTKTHRTYLAKLREFSKVVLNFKSAVDCVKYFIKT